MTVAVDLVNYLATVEEVTDLVDSSSDVGPYIFHGKLHIKPAEPNNALVVVQHGSATLGSRFHPSARWPLLRVEAYSHDELSAYRVMEAVDFAIVKPWQEQYWDGLRVLDCMRMTESDPIETPWWHGLHVYGDYSVLVA